MSDAFRRVKFIDRVTKLLVHGYIRREQRQIASNCGKLQCKPLSIPNDIIQICLIYVYSDWETFDTASTHIAISSQFRHRNKLGIRSNNIASNLNTHSLGCWGNAYGRIEIDCAKYPRSVYRWKFAVNAPEITIGIDSKSRCPDSTYCFTRQSKCDKSKFYAFGSGGHLESHDIDLSLALMTSLHHRYGASTYIGDTVTMVLDTGQRTLRYLQNQTDLGIAFDNIDTSKVYRMAVSLYLQSSSVELVDFTFSS